MTPTTKNTNIDSLTSAIDNALSEMQSHEVNTPEYAACVDQIEKLFKIKASYKKETANLGVNFKDLLPVIGNLAGIFAILNYERVNVITTKALGFVLKSKV